MTTHLVDINNNIHLSFDLKRKATDAAGDDVVPEKLKRRSVSDHFIIGCTNSDRK